MPITVQDRGSVRREEGDLDQTYLWEKVAGDMKAGFSDGAKLLSGAVSQDCTKLPTEQAATQGSAPGTGGMQSSAVAQDCVPSHEGASILVRVIQARAGDEESSGLMTGAQTSLNST